MDSRTQKLYSSKVLLVGSGGLGSPAMWLLARSGVGTLGIVDNDSVTMSNLNRKIIHGVSRLGMEKVLSAKETLEMLNPKIRVETHTERFKDENARDLLIISHSRQHRYAYERHPYA